MNRRQVNTKEGLLSHTVHISRYVKTRYIKEKTKQFHFSDIHNVHIPYIRAHILTRYRTNN